VFVLPFAESMAREGREASGGGAFARAFGGGRARSVVPARGCGGYEAEWSRTLVDHAAATPQR